MRSRTRLGFALTVGSNVLLFIGWIIPFWFGRFYGTNSKTQWSLFYRIQCVRGRCQTIGGILSNEIVNFEGGEQRIELEAVVILATIGFALCLLSLGIVLFFHCSLCGKTFSYFNYIFGAAIVQFAAAIFVFLTIVIAGIAAGDFLSVRKMDSVIEFPWAILFYSFGLILLIASAIIFILIVINWKRYRYIYARKRYYFNRAIQEPYTITNKSDHYRSRANSNERYRYERRPYFSESNLFGVDNGSYSGSLRYKFDPKREKYVGFLTDVRNEKPYSSMPIRSTRHIDRTRAINEDLILCDITMTSTANREHVESVELSLLYRATETTVTNIVKLTRNGFGMKLNECVERVLSEFHGR